MAAAAAGIEWHAAPVMDRLWLASADSASPTAGCVALRFARTTRRRRCSLAILAVWRLDDGPKQLSRPHIQDVLTPALDALADDEYEYRSVSFSCNSPL